MVIEKIHFFNHHFLMDHVKSAQKNKNKVVKNNKNVEKR